MRLRWILALALAAALGGACRRQTPVAVDADTALARGWECLRLAEYDRALPAFEQAVAAADAGTEQAVRALYSLGCYWNLRRPDADRPKAAAIFSDVIAKHPSSTWAAWSALAMARQIQLDAIETLPDAAKLESAYRGVIARYPDHPAATEALLFIQSARLVRADDTSAVAAIAELDAFVHAHPDSPYASAAWSLLAQGYFLRHQGPERVNALIRAWESSSAIAAGEIQGDPALTYFRIATAAQFDAGDFATARRFYRLLIQEYPTEQKAFVAKQELRRMDETEAQVLAELGAATGGEARP